MQRYSIFNQVHKGLRVLLFETALAFQRANFADTEDARPVLEKAAEAMNLFAKKNRLQELYIIPVIELHEPLLALTLRQKNLAHYQSYEQLKQLLSAYSTEQSATGRLLAGNAMVKAWTVFLVDNLEEMREDERDLHKALCNQYTDQQLIRIEHYIRDTLTPEELLAFGKWMLRGSTITESIRWLKEVQKYIDPATFSSLYAMAEQALGKDRFRLVMDGLAEGSSME